MNASGTAYESHLRDAIDQRCRERGCDLLVVYGRAFEDPVAASAAHNAIFDLVGPEVVDGLLLISSCLSAYCGLEGIARLICRYRSLPLCSIGLALPGVPSIVADNLPGMRAVIEHIIEHHRCRKIAFLAGTRDNPEAELRLEVYREGLERHGIEVDQELVVDGYFSKCQAANGLSTMLGRGIRPDAIVAANDAMAVGAMEALRKHGQRVPLDVLVSGYDDMPFARLGNPPLTTVRQPLSAMAQAAVDLLLDQIDGKSVPTITRLPTELVVRRSCGCQRRLTPARRVLQTDGRSPLQVVTLENSRLGRAMAASMAGGTTDPMPDVERLLSGLQSELSGQPDAFLHAVEAIMEDCANDDDRGRTVQLAVMTLRQELSAVTTLELEDIFHEASLAIALANGSGRALSRLTADERSFYLMRSAELTNLAMDLRALERVLCTVLPELGVQTAFLSRFTGEDRQELESFVVLVRGKPTRSGSRFFVRELFPPGEFPANCRRTLLVYPIVYEGQALGVAAFEYEDRFAAYNTLLVQASVALRNIELHAEIVQKTLLHERSIQERLATSKRLEALGLLAGCVAHDLNNTLSPILALSEVVLHELSQAPPMIDHLEDIRADVETIRTASLQASQTIKDLLTLGRQGRLAKTSLDLNGVVEKCLQTSFLAAAREHHPGIELRVELSPTPVVVRGSEAQLARATANLIHNAIDALPGRGRVTVRTTRVEVKEPKLGYERIEPGDYGVVSVADDGVGIATTELGRIFDPFFSKKRTADRSGTGLGLSIVHGVTREHDGYVDVASVAGKGSTFSLYIPLTEEPVPVPRSEPLVRGGNAKILVVDDDRLVLRTCRRVLQRLGYRVDTMTSGRQAYELFGRTNPAGPSPYDLVIMDMVLNEDEDGLEVIERIRQVFPHQRAILASGHAATGRAEKALEGGLCWLAKPYSADRLARLVQALLES